jgi:arylsulfate sulfotransferase
MSLARRSGVVEREVKQIPDSLHPARGLKLAVPVLQEVQHGKVLWQWMASDHAEFFTSSIRGNNFSDMRAKHDYLHINSITMDPADSNIIVSFRHADQVVKIERGSGKVLWKLGGRNSDFKLMPEQIFYKQHSAVITVGGELLLFDNGDKISREKSRILWFRLDEKQKKVIGFRSFVPDQNFSMYMGSAEVCGDTLYVAGGSANYVMEYSLRTGEKLFGFHSDMAQYRVYRAQDISGIPTRMDQKCAVVYADTLNSHLNK